MGRAPCCDKANVKKGPWSPEEDSKLKDFIDKYGTGGNWIALPQKAGLKRCGKSCRLRWLNYLRPNIKHGEFSEEEDRIICTLFTSIGSRWSIIAAQLPGRTDNDIKNYWNTKLKKKLMANHMANNNPLNQRKLPPYPPPPPPSLLQTPLHSQLQSYFYNPIKSLSSLDQPTSIIPPNSLNNFDNYNFTLLQEAQDSLFSPMNYYPPLKESMLVFGGEHQAASCSSSDGSCSLGKEIKQEENIGFHHQSLISSGFEQNQKFMLDFVNNNENPQLTSQWGDQNPKVYFGNSGGVTPLEYDDIHEEVKQQLVSNSNSSLLFNDENKTGEKTMYYYYY